MVCEPFLLAKALQRKGLNPYMYNFNQTLLDPIIEQVYGIKGMGVVHTSEFAYMFGNLSHYNVSGMYSILKTHFSSSFTKTTRQRISIQPYSVGLCTCGAC